jgi:hypothetical protein
MDNLEKDKYIVLYLDRNEECGVFRKLHTPAAPHLKQALLGASELNIFSKKIYEIYGLKVIHFLLNYENKQINKEENNNELLIQIYQDDYIEEYIIKECFCIMYCSKFKRSKNLIDLLLKYEKNVINLDNIENILDKNITQLGTYEQDKTIFIEYYKNLIHLENIYQQKDYFQRIQVGLVSNTESMDLLQTDGACERLHTKNIKLIWHKKIKKNIGEHQNSDKIHLITYYKETDIKLLNIIQKKCIFENYKNKSIIKLLIIGKNLIEEFKDIIENDITKKIILHDISGDILSNKENISFKYLIDISNTIFLNKIICILRSDIILPNQNELDDLEIDLLSDKKQVFSVSRIERLINGNLVKSDKLHKILNCTEQDVWFFKSPLDITNENVMKLDMINFYDKYSELYFNNILKDEGYNVINNTKKYKIIRLLYENNIENRPLLNLNNELNIKNNLENISLLPDNNSVDKISIDQILSSCKLDDIELYHIKCELINKYFKNKIFI